MKPMSDWITFIVACALFLVGMRLSAFFSGSETGFYRLSIPRLRIDAHAGDRIAQRLLWFARNPSYFVATTLVGNNVANYLTTLAIGLGTVTVIHASPGWVEVLATLLLSPLVFVWGEVIPKNLYYRAPMFFLRRDCAWFMFFLRLFLPVSLPLIGMTKLFERLRHSTEATLEFVLGRKLLVQVLSQGSQQGILTNVQGRLVHGLLHTAAQPIIGSITPADRVLGVDESTSREKILVYAREYGVASVAVKRKGSAEDWYGYVRAVDVAISQRPLAKLIRTMPVLSPSVSKLQALLTIQQAAEAYGVVCDNGKVLGTVSERGLVEQLIRPVQTVAGKPHIVSGVGRG